MSCPTCGHTMQCVGFINQTDSDIFWCPRCGTIFDRANPTPNVPKLVERCREMEKALGPEWVAQCGHLKTKWKQLGIAESINLPENRS